MENSRVQCASWGAQTEPLTFIQSVNFAHPDTSGNGTLTGIEKYSQAEFDEHTQSSKEAQTNSGECVVMQG